MLRVSTLRLNETNAVGTRISLAVKAPCNSVEDFTGPTVTADMLLRVVAPRSPHAPGPTHSGSACPWGRARQGGRQWLKAG